MSIQIWVGLTDFEIQFQEIFRTNWDVCDVDGLLCGTFESIKKRSHSKEDPDLHTETVRAAISGAYHVNWSLHSRLVNKDKKDKAAGKALCRSHRNSSRTPTFMYIFSCNTYFDHLTRSLRSEFSSLCRSNRTSDWQKKELLFKRILKGSWAFGIFEINSRQRHFLIYLCMFGRTLEFLVTGCISH